MPKIISFPIPYDAIAKYECPHGHKAGWEIYAVNHNGDEAFLTIKCRSKCCDYSTTGMFLTGIATEEMLIEE